MSTAVDSGRDIEPAAGRLAGRVALVSGAGGPMGAAIAARFLAEGAHLVLNEISQRRLDETVATLAALVPGAAIVAERGNVLDDTEVAAVVNAGLARFGRIDLLVNVVGGIRVGALTESLLTMSPERWSSTFALNLDSVFHMVRRVAPGMVAQGYGRIVNIASVTYAGDAEQPEYGAAKAGVASLTRALAQDLAPRVTVNCVAPGLIRTSVLDRADPALVERYRARALLGRLGEPRDVANAALFLASDEAAYITGAILPVSGGIWPAL